MSRRTPSARGGRGPTADPSLQGQWRRQHRTTEDLQAAAIRDTMATEAGRHFVAWILDDVLSRGRPTFVVGDPYSTAGNAAVMDRGLEFIQRLQEVVPDLYVLMQREQVEAWFERAREASQDAGAAAAPDEGEGTE